MVALPQKKNKLSGIGQCSATPAAAKQSTEYAANDFPANG
jgi:hypothetical protein